jgi:phospholipase C
LPLLWERKNDYASTAVSVSRHRHGCRAGSSPLANAADVKTATPIKHIVIIFGENRSFDHYFGTYPNALNPKGEPAFHAVRDTPSVNGLSNALLNFNNPISTRPTAAALATLFALIARKAFTQDMDHDYLAEQLAFDGGVMDLFPANTGSAGPPPNPPPASVLTNGQVMGYYDGNSTTALWNYAQHYAMSDNSYSTNFGPSTVGAINLISGQTNGVAKHANGTGGLVGDGNGG